MKLKKFNELNEANDPNDGANKLPKNIKDAVAQLLFDISSEINVYLDQSFGVESEEGNNKFEYTIKVPMGLQFSKFILDFIEEKGLYYNVNIHIKRDYPATMLRFEDEDTNSAFLIPIIINMRGDDMIYPGNDKLKYSVWINTYVAEKIR